MRGPGGGQPVDPQSRRRGDPERAGAVGRHRRQRRDRAPARRRHAPGTYVGRRSGRGEAAARRPRRSPARRSPPTAAARRPQRRPAQVRPADGSLDDLPTQRLLDLVPARRHEARRARQPLPDVPGPPLLRRRPRGVGQRGGGGAARSLQPADRSRPRRQRSRPRRPRAGLQPDRRALHLDRASSTSRASTSSRSPSRRAPTTKRAAPRRAPARTPRATTDARGADRRRPGPPGSARRHER